MIDPIDDKQIISVVVPVYNGDGTLMDLFVRVQSFMKAMEWTYEILFVDDGSADNSWQVISELHRINSDQVKGFRLARNSGQQAATLCGILQAKGSWIFTLDDDLQTPPEEMASLWGKAKQSSADIVYGIYPLLRHSFLYNLGTRLFRRIFRKVAPEYPNGSSFRLIRGEIVKLLPGEHHPWVFVDPAFSWVTDKITTVEVRHEKRHKGKSRYSISKLISLALSLFIVYSTVPLRLMIWFGLLASALSFGLGIFFLYQKLTVGAPLGFSALIVTLTFTSGVILLSLGILGEYISRIYSIQTGRRAFTIKTALT